MQQPITNPPVPYVGPVQGGLAPGLMVRIQGQVPPNADRFNINLHCGPPPSDVAFHMSVRLLQNYVARNSLQGGNWGSEEDSGNLTITPGQRFEVLILCDPDSYKVAVNGNHFCEFKHRIPFQQVNHLAIDGDVSLGLIAYEGLASAPPMGGPDFAPPPPQYGPPPPGYGPPPPGQYSPSPYGGPGYGPPRPSHGSIPAPKNVPLGNQPPPMSMPMPTSVPLPPPSVPPGYGQPPHMPPYGAPPLPPYVAPPAPSYGAAPVPPYGAPPLPPYRAPPMPPSASYPVQLGGPMPGQPAGYGQTYAYSPPGVYPHKKMKKSKLKKAMKYGLPIAGAGIGAYAISQALSPHHHHRSSSSSSSSSSD